MAQQKRKPPRLPKRMSASPRLARPAREPAAARHQAVVPGNGAWEKLRPRTLVDQALDAIVAGAARGLILPGDRIVETEIARALGISRVPVREALRLLESQGLVVSEPFKGIRLMPVTQQRLDQALEVRVTLETTAARRALAPGADKGEALRRLTRCVDELELMAARQDAYGCAEADTAFHRELCRLGGNEVLCAMWEQLARQLTIIVGLSTFGKPMRELVAEHRSLLKVFAAGRPRDVAAALDEHIRLQNEVIDFEKLVKERRRAIRASGE
ncbi:MAG: GntR family transcriptional regulator [Hyphomicrobiales bacterium]